MTFVLVICRPRDLCVVVTGVSENNVISQNLVKNSFTNKVYHDIMSYTSFKFKCKKMLRATVKEIVLRLPTYPVLAKLVQ